MFAVSCKVVFVWKEKVNQMSSTGTVEQAAWFHGLGKKSPEDVHSAVLDDLKSLSEYLSMSHLTKLCIGGIFYMKKYKIAGTKKFFMGGDKATELDVI